MGRQRCRSTHVARTFDPVLARLQQNRRQASDHPLEHRIEQLRLLLVRRDDLVEPLVERLGRCPSRGCSLVVLRGPVGASTSDVVAPHSPQKARFRLDDPVEEVPVRRKHMIPLIGARLVSVFVSVFVFVHVAAC